MDRLPVIPGYRIKHVLGSGSAGTVFLAEQEALGREVALKVLTGWIADRTGRQRFQLEAQTLAGLSHANLLRLFAYSGDDAVPWIAVEYLSGGSLRDRIRTASGGGVPLPVPEALRLARNLLWALDALHAANLIHRDVKPANILYRSTGEAVLGDLGLVRQADSEKTRLTRPIDMVGTTAYLAPEAQTGHELTAQTDLFAAGVTLYEAVCGKHPTDYTPITKGFRPRPPQELRPEAPLELCEMISAMLEPDPADRPATAKDTLLLLGSKRNPSHKVPKLPSKPAPAAAYTPAAGSVGSTSRAFRWGLVAGAVAALFGLASQLSRPAAPLALPVKIEAHSTSVNARVPGASPDLVFTVFDEKGRVQACVNGEPAGDHTGFHVGSLEPGTSYHAQIFSRKVGVAVAPSDTAFRTPVQLKLLGVEDGATPGLWLAVTPPADVRWAGGRSAIRVGPDGKRLSLAGAAARELELAFPGETVRVKVDYASPAEPAAAVLPLGVSLPKLAGKISRAGGSRSLVDWLVESHVGWVVVGAGPDGGPALAEAETKELWMRGRIGTLYLVTAPNPPAQTPWTEKLPELAAGRLELSVDPEWMYNVLDETSFQQTLRTLAGWRDTFAGHTPPQPLTIPTPGSFLMFLTNPGTSGTKWSKILPEVRAIETLAGGAPAWHTLWKERMEPKLAAAGCVVDVRWVMFVRATRETMGLDMPIERFSLARAYALSRARFPKAVVVIDIGDLTDGPERQMRPACADLLWIGQRMAGLAFDRELTDAHGPAPHLTSANGVVGLSFHSASRHVQMLFPPHPTTARFEPARPGIFRDQGGSVSRPLLTTAPVDLPLTDASATFEELAPVEAEVRGPASVDIVR